MLNIEFLLFMDKNRQSNGKRQFIKNKLIKLPSIQQSSNISSHTFENIQESFQFIIEYLQSSLLELPQATGKRVLEAVLILKQCSKGNISRKKNRKVLSTSKTSKLAPLKESFISDKENDEMQVKKMNLRKRTPKKRTIFQENQRDLKLDECSLRNTPRLIQKVNRQEQQGHNPSQQNIQTLNSSHKYEKDLLQEMEYLKEQNFTLEKKIKELIVQNQKVQNQLSLLKQDSQQNQAWKKENYTKIQFFKENQKIMISLINEYSKQIEKLIDEKKKKRII